MDLKQLINKTLPLTLLLISSFSVQAKNYEEIIEELNTGSFPKDDIVGNMIDFRAFQIIF